MRGRVVSESETGDFRPGVKRKFLTGDIVLALVSDEERGGTYGAKYLIDHHADLFEGIRYAIGEWGRSLFTCGDAGSTPSWSLKRAPAS